MLESLMATGILLATVMAVTGAIAAGQQHAHEAKLRIAGALAAEELLGRMLLERYEDLSGWDGYAEEPGRMKLIDRAELPTVFDPIGRSVHVRSTDMKVTELGIVLRGRTVTVTAIDGNRRELVTLDRFFVEPAS